MDQLLCLWGASASVYKGLEGGGWPAKVWRARRVLLPLGVGFPPPPILVGIGFAEGGIEREGPAPSPCLIRTKGGEGRAAHEGLPLLFSTKAHHGPYSSRGVPVTSRYSGKIPISPGTLPISKHRLPIYQSLCLDHFETPRHVHDHIRDSEQPSVHQNA